MSYDVNKFWFETIWKSTQLSFQVKFVRRNFPLSRIYVTLQDRHTSRCTYNPRTVHILRRSRVTQVVWLGEVFHRRQALYRSEKRKLRVKIAFIGGANAMKNRVVFQYQTPSPFDSGRRVVSFGSRVAPQLLVVYRYSFVEIARHAFEIWKFSRALIDFDSNNARVDLPHPPRRSSVPFCDRITWHPNRGRHIIN